MNWREFEERYDLVGVPYEKTLSIEVNKNERTYILDTLVYKSRNIPPDQISQPGKSLPHHELGIMRYLLGVKGLSKVVEFVEREDHTIIKIARIPNSERLDRVPIPISKRQYVLSQQYKILKQVNDAGVIHNDSVDRNWVIDDVYNVTLIDFDAAEIKTGSDRIDGLWKSEISSDEERLGMIKAAWRLAEESDANDPGQHISYDAAICMGSNFPGERPFEERWFHIGGCLRELLGGFVDTRILDLGCNLGMFGIALACEKAFHTGVERYSDVIDANRLLSRAFQVEGLTRWICHDMIEKPPPEIYEEYDVCMCLSMWRWLDNEEYVRDILMQQKVLLFEGHRPDDEIEVWLRQDLGFTSVKKIVVSERSRGVFLAQRS